MLGNIQLIFCFYPYISKSVEKELKIFPLIFKIENHAELMRPSV